jgi:hypothetical protein
MPGESARGKGLLFSLPMCPRSGEAAARFFLGVAQAGASAKVYDEHTLPLFPLALIMDAEGLLA